MRRTLKILLILFPAVVVVVLFRVLENEPDRGIRTIDTRVSGERPDVNETLAGFAGKGTFYRRLSPVVIGGQQLSYPSTYYLLDEWLRDENDVFVITGLLVVSNPRPHSRDDLDDILEVGNEGGSAARRRILEEGRERYDSLRAGKGRALGGRTVADCDTFELEGGVEALVPGRDPAAGRLKIETTVASLGMVEGGLDRVDLPERFTATHPDYELGGIGLHAEGESPEVRINSEPEMVSVSTATPGARRTISAEGALVWMPDPDPDGSPPDILDRLRLDLGDIRLSDQVRFEIDDVVVTGAEAEARIGKPDGAEVGKLTSFLIDGAVTVASPRGRVTGDRARGTLLPDGSFTIVIEGERNELSWELDAGKPETGRLEASCRAAMSLRVPSRKRREVDPLLIQLRREVELDLKDGDQLTHVEGDDLTVLLARVPLNRVDGEPETAWRLREATLVGSVTGKTRDSVFSGPRLRLLRDHDDAGLHLRDRLVLDGPAVVSRPQGLGRVDPDLLTVIEAARRLQIDVPASPFDDGVATAEGAVLVEERRGAIIERNIACDRLQVIAGPVATELGKSDRYLKRLEANGNVVARDREGSELVGDLVTWTREERTGRVIGAPARARFVDGNDKPQRLEAKTIEFNSSSGKIVADGGVTGRVHFAELKSADGEEKTERKIVAWDLKGGRVEGIFEGNMPVAEPGPAPEGGDEEQSARLVEFDLDGDVEVKGPEQVFVADRVHHDLRKGTGWAEGKPARLVVTRLYEDGSRGNDVFEAPRMLVDPDWTLLESGGRAEMLVPEDSPPPGRAPRREKLRVVCAGDVLLKDLDLISSGRTRLTRGDPVAGGLELESDRATATFASRKGGGKGPGDLLIVGGTGNVSMKRGEIQGEGDVLTFDYRERRVLLEAEPGRRCVMRKGRGYAARGESLAYDLRSRKVSILKVGGTIKERNGTSR